MTNRTPYIPDEQKDAYEKSSFVNKTAAQLKREAAATATPAAKPATTTKTKARK